MSTLAADGSVDLFGHEGQAKMYKDFRPRYTKEVVEFVLSKVSERGLCVDVACGSGQLTNLLGPHFAKVIGIDRSFEQLSNASSSAPNIEYRAGSAFALPVDSGSADLTTVAQGLHWLVPYENFFTEVRRVLKPGGVFVTVGYMFPRLVNAKANKAALYFYEEVLKSKLSPGDPGCWWETNRPTIDCEYRDIPFPGKIERVSLPAIVEVSIPHYVSYLRTLSAYRTLMKSGAEDPLVKLETEVVNAVGDPAAMIEVVNPFFAVCMM